MLSNREKEIIRNVYMAVSGQVYTSSGPSYLSQTDHQEISNFLHQLKNDKIPQKHDCTTCEYGKYNDRYDTHFCSHPDRRKCKMWELWEEKRTCYNCKNRIYDLFDGDAFCPIAKDCNNKSKWEGK